VDTAVRSRPVIHQNPRDSKWKNVTHLGEEYAALMVDPSYSPPQITEVLPATGGAVAAVAVVKGQTPDPSSPPKCSILAVTIG